MNQTQAGWLLILAAIGMMATLVSTDIAALSNWHDMMEPKFVALMLAHMGAVITAAIGGKLLPTN